MSFHWPIGRKGTEGGSQMSKRFSYVTCTWVACCLLKPAFLHAATITQSETWSLFSGPNDPQTLEMRSIDMFDPSLGVLTQVDWSVNAALNASFVTAPSSFPIAYTVGALIGCGGVFPVIGLSGCDLVNFPLQSDARSGVTFPFTEPVGANETIALLYDGTFSFTDATELAIFTGTTPLSLSLLVDTSAQAEICLTNPFTGQEECTPVQVAYSGSYTGDLSVTYTYDPVPIPAAAWLFGSGLFGLIAIARRKGKQRLSLDQ